MSQRSRKLKSTISLKARLLRWRMRRARKMLRYGGASLRKSPIFFANSFPKSGTHLLTQVINGFTHVGPAVNSGLPAIVTFEGFTGRQRREDEILIDFMRLLPGDIAYGHVHSFPGAVDFLCREGRVSFFILRDPRDVAVSHVHYITEMEPDHIHHRYYKESLSTFDQRLKASIVGVRNNKYNATTNVATSVLLPDIRERFEPFMGWLHHPEVFVLRFEDLIMRREHTIGQIFDHAAKRGFQPDFKREKVTQFLAQNIAPERSPTFRSGNIGSWQASFSQEHKRNFKNVMGDLLIRLGYEENYDW